MSNVPVAMTRSLFILHFTTTITIVTSVIVSTSTTITAMDVTMIIIWEDRGDAISLGNSEKEKERSRTCMIVINKARQAHPSTQ